MDTSDRNKLMTREEWERQAVKEGWIEPSGKFAKLNDKLYLFNGTDPLVRVDLAEYKTGQEWYDRFEKELPRLGEIVTKEYNDGYADAVIAALTAAKKSAGIE